MRYLMTGLIATLCLGLSGCGYNTIQTQDEAIKAAWSEVVNQYQRRADLIPNLVNTVKGYAAQEQNVFDRRHRGARPRDLDPGDAGDAERPRGAQEIPGRAGRADQCAEEPDRRQREVPGPQVGPEFPRPAGAARGHGEPHHRRAQPLHRNRADLQRHDPAIPGEPDRDDVRLRREAELHGRERGGDFEAADGRLQYEAAQSPRPRRGPDRDRSIDDAGFPAALCRAGGGAPARRPADHRIRRGAATDPAA